MLQLVWNFAAQVAGGPAVTATSSPEIGAIDKAVVKIKNDGNDVEVDLQPAALDKLLLLVVHSSVPTADVTVIISDGAGTPKKTGKLPLTQPLLLAGASLSLLPGAPLKAILNFAKVVGSPDIWATIELVAARKT
ncbi:hypothetical protein OF829_04605 [Sphingomonas sp. LB-2]|uniref:hypothetical protein n=1 Tax=Sphingomonas caeni TaxID=2984949 RepID=UPI00222EAB68|nr:hypothetical protein [Sphingomonas caeni]MCW3846508.1 hypothetical protein [Sphingomonas caeni]